LVLVALNLHHQQATNIIHRRRAVVVVALPGAYLHRVRGWGLGWVTPTDRGDDGRARRRQGLAHALTCQHAEPGAVMATATGVHKPSVL
jgi:hypothetical protein